MDEWQMLGQPAEQSEPVRRPSWLAQTLFWLALLAFAVTAFGLLR